MKEFFASIAVCLAVAGNVPYSYGILKGRIKPHAYSWFVWSVVSAVILVGQIEKGAGVGAASTLVSEVFTFTNFLLSLRYGYRDVKRIDTIFLLLALSGIGIWLTMDDPTFAMVIVVSIDVIAFVPTLRKTWSEPRTEGRSLYALNVARHIVSILALEAYNLATTLHSVAMIVTNGLMTAFLRRKTKIEKNSLV